MDRAVMKQIIPEDTVEAGFFNKELITILQDTGFSNSILLDKLSSDETGTSHYALKHIQIEDEIVFPDGEFLQTFSDLSTVGEFSEALISLPEALKHLKFASYCNFTLEGNLSLVCFSGHQELPKSNIIRFLDFIVNSQFQRFKLKQNIIELEAKADSLTLELDRKNEIVSEPEEELEAQSQILLAEDNPANQMLIIQQLELLGYTVDVAEDGEQAYKLWEKRNYRLLLTDCNMPVMDGFALTAAIREKEKNNGSHIPIVAVTANAMQGESEKCLSLGMDDYLSKPIKLKALKEILERWFTTKQSEQISTQKNTTPETIKTSQLSVVDFNELDELLGSDIEMQQKFLQSFMQTAPDIVNQVSAACETGSIEQIDFNLHKLKSSAKAIGASKLLETSLAIESLLSTADWKEIKKLSIKLTQNLDEVTACVAEFNHQGKERKKDPIVDNLSAFTIPEGIRVLVLDDDPFMLDYIKIMLTKLGVFEISLSDQGENALQILKNTATTIDVVFCDLNMPGMDGVTFLRHLSDLKYRGGIVINSGEDAGILSVVSELATAHQLNLLGTLKKPLMPEQVLSLFQKMEQQNTEKNSKKTLIKTPQFEFTVSDLEKGIEENHIVVYYQPKICIKTREIIGFEALARWNDPLRGIIPPYLFIPIAEAENLIGQLTDKVFTQSVAQTKIWCQDYPDVKVSVNFAMQTLDRLDLPDVLIENLRDFGVSASNIIIEVTESGLMENLAVNMEVLARLKMLGFTLSIDDFGTGYSSMNQLQRLPFSELKLDYSFVHGAVHDPKARAILESSIHLAKNLNLTIVAEGVETQQDWDLIKELGCDVVQGFFIAKPMPAKECSQWLKKWSLSEHNNL